MYKPEKHVTSPMTYLTAFQKRLENIADKHPRTILIENTLQSPRHEINQIFHVGDILNSEEFLFVEVLYIVNPTRDILGSTF
ncbi:hypothetical protein NQ317_016491 [Molorchus minor]|uniref:Uncharacterized protein n=1 Tax=Molorchus minor TaxID=1323400 RepID=A0ABQ9JGT3_9CUCU|nr:hypothetical protein NQ317_016491 [Molorchus minor]